MSDRSTDCTTVSQTSQIPLENRLGKGIPIRFVPLKSLSVTGECGAGAARIDTRFSQIRISRNDYDFETVDISNVSLLVQIYARLNILTLTLNK